jgi:hypothetical protein
MIFARRIAVLSTFLTACAGAALAQTAFTPRDENPEEFPSGVGRDDAFYACTGCHNFKLVAAQGMTRPQWEDTLAWMTAKHGMPALTGKQRNVVLDYLDTAFPPRAPARGGANPFLR